MKAPGSKPTPPHTAEIRRFPHAMLREIFEQPQAFRQTFEAQVRGADIFPSSAGAVESAVSSFNKIIIAASGSSRHAGLAGEIMIEDVCGIPVDVEYASEYCYRSTHATADPVVMVISQSGETADTLAAQREARERGANTIAVCNAPDSTLVREASAALLTHAGQETAIPATKSFSTQLLVLYLFALFMARRRGRTTAQATVQHLHRLQALPNLIQRELPLWEGATREIARQIHRAATILCLGRGVHYPIAREGALKVKEISYIHAEGYPAGELKHGPNALLHERLPVIVLATVDRNDADSQLRYRKTCAMLSEIQKEGGELVIVATEGDEAIAKFSSKIVYVPETPELMLPMIEIVPLQLLAYHIGVMNDCDVDNPRNLVKAVVRE